MQSSRVRNLEAYRDVLNLLRSQPTALKDTQGWHVYHYSQVPTNRALHVELLNSSCPVTTCGKDTFANSPTKELEVYLVQIDF